MVTSRIIPILLLRNGRMVKGRGFDRYRDVGDPVSAVRIYNAQNVDELVFLDIDATRESRRARTDVVERISFECFVPITIGGGVRTVEDVRALLNSGADKVAINTAAVEDPRLLPDAADVFGSQCIVLSLDVRREDGRPIVYTHSGTVRTGIMVAEFLARLDPFPAGEVLVNVIDRDGMMTGYDLDLIRLVHEHCRAPVIIAGGSGNLEHLYQAISSTNVSGVGCGSVFYFADNNPIRARSYLRQKGLPTRNV